MKADPALAKIAHELVESIRTDLTVDWADRAATEAKIRAKIKTAAPQAQVPSSARTGVAAAMTALISPRQLVLDQAKALYRYWPDVEVGDRLFA